jgi:predicted transposase/invertase (TIGR01784 family)
MPSVFIDPKTDFAFKKIFGSPQSKDILISFLDAMLYDGTGSILDLTILDPYQAPRIQGIKESFLDVKAVLASGQTVIIEMQVLNVLGFDKRVLYNAAKAFSIQLEVGDDYTRLNPVIALTITDFEMFPNSPKVISHYRLMERTELTDYSDDIELVFAELPKFTKSLPELDSLIDKWLFFLRSASQLQSVPPSLDGIPALHQAFEVAQQSRLSPEELEILEKRQMFLHDNRNAILYAEQKGIKKGMEKGMEKGIEKGLEDGKRLKALEIARQLLDVLDVETIAQKTGLAIAEIEQLCL